MESLLRQIHDTDTKDENMCLLKSVSNHVSESDISVTRLSKDNRESIIVESCFMKTMQGFYVCFVEKIQNRKV